MSSPEDVHIGPPNPAWPELFEQEKQNILTHLGPHFIAIEHFGSTAVPGLHAKPILDMLGGVASMAVADQLLEPLCKLGWETSAEFNATLADRRFLRRRNAREIRTHHLHLVVHDSTEQWKVRLAFRDYLRAHPETAREYERLKYELAERHRTDREAYTEAKTDFVTNVLKLALTY